MHDDVIGLQEGENRLAFGKRADVEKFGGNQLQAPAGFVAGSVTRITHYRKSDEVEMAADLMEPAGFYPDNGFGCIGSGVMGQHLILGLRRFVVQWDIDFCFLSRKQIAAHFDKVAFPDQVLLKKGGEFPRRLLAVRYEHKAFRFAVEPVDEKNQALRVEKEFRLTQQGTVVAVLRTLRHEARRFVPDAVMALVMQTAGPWRDKGKERFVVVEGQDISCLRNCRGPAQASAFSFLFFEPHRAFCHGLLDFAPGKTGFCREQVAGGLPVTGRDG